MMFRLVYRLKKKHGAVLFAVIAVMALLIAMSTAAYYTARGSYNTVVSNYNYSQLYLSAISSADMISAAIMNTPVPSAETVNDFDTIRTQIRNNLNAINDSIYLKSSNLASVAVNASTSQQTVIAALANVTPIEAGVLDGLTVEIKVLNVVADPSPYVSDVTTSGNTTTTTYTVKPTFTYGITTTAYYNENTITVQDIISTKKVGTYTVTTTSGSGNGLPSNFNPNIATGQGQPGLDGKATDPDRSVIVNVTEINGDAAFRNDKTYLGVDGHDVGNKLKGGVISEGSLIIRHGDAAVEGTNNNWYVGQDLVMTHANGDLDLGSNDLYVGGDFILGANGGAVKARDIYVQGDLYVLDTKSINAENLHVEGNIYYTVKDENGNYRNEIFKDTNIEWGGGWTSSDNIKGGISLNSSCNLSLGGHIYTDGITMGGNTLGKRQNDITIGQYSNLSHGDTHSAGNGIGDYKFTDQTIHEYSVLTATSDGSRYEKKPTSGSAKDALIANAGMKENGDPKSIVEKDVYPNYTADQDAYNNKATIDFGALEPQLDANNQVIGYRGEYQIGSTGKYITVEVDGNSIQNAKDINIDIPYVKEGMLLDYTSTTEEVVTYWGITKEAYTDENGVYHEAEWGKVVNKSTGSGLSGGLGNQNILHYNINTDPSGESMPIVLAANQSDGNFSWTGDSAAKGADVTVKGNGKVTFEMGNLNTETGKYEPFHVGNADKYAIPTYVQKGATGQVSVVVGSEDQVNDIGGADNFQGIDKSKAQSIEQRSNVMLVSNKSGTAFSAIGKSGVFCGYIYAPNGTLAADYDTNGVVINVGSVVISSYEAQAASYQVALPTPDDMTAFIGALNGNTGVDWSTVNGGGGGGGGGSTPPTSDTSPTTYNSFESWTEIGSNYVGDLVIVSSGSSGGSTAGEGE